MSTNTTTANPIGCVLHSRRYTNLRGMKCFFSTITLFLYDYHFAYFCFALLFIIVVISIFGKIKGDYRWFILNQALWDIGITYSYMQNDAIYIFAETGYTFRNIQILEYGLEFINDVIDTNPYTSLLLLSWSRFLALYFSHFYDRLTSKKRIFVIIIGFNFFVLFFHISPVFNMFLSKTRTRLNLECQKNNHYTYCRTWYQSQPLYIFLLYSYNIFHSIVLLKPIIFLCLSIFAAIMILKKIGKQAKFQLKHNRRDFFVSFRISAVILFQTLINCILVFVEFTESIDNVFEDVLKIRFVKHELCSAKPDLDGPCMDFLQLPDWLDDDALEQGLESPIIYPAFKQLRIFLESIIIIAVMAGYREAIINFFKYFYRLFKKSNPTSPSNSILFVSRASSVAIPNAS